ncbi:MAG: type I-B CRISPR-associated protein Cas7/Cst2/DevR [Candidatus Lokiarchaeota archaeon]|nr:type I-B CRISPR-associated protein Cas7/Cst2/DevR [Candidatus Lokiarchaeota archaeon]
MEFLNIAYVSKVNIASLNGSEGTGGNIVTIKKITDNQGNEFAYISGQAQRRYLKETLRQLGENITAVNERGEPDFREYNTKIYASDKGEKFKDMELMYKNFCDLDLFGYMMPKGGRRWSPVKVAPMLSVLPYKGEYDYLTRKQAVKDETKKSGNIVQVEVDTLNFMRGNILIDVTKIGKEINEYNYEFNQILSNEEIDHRINILIEAIKVFNGGAKQSRNLEDISPKFVIAISQRAGNPFLLNTFKIDKYNNLEVKPIIEAIKENSDYIESKAVGLTTNIFQNEEEIKSKFQEIGVEIISVSQALDTLKKKRE